MTARWPGCTNYILQREPAQEYNIVHALDGYDEISLTGGAAVRSKTSQRHLYPEDFGLPQLKQADLHGGSTIESGKRIFLSVLDETATKAQRAVVCANAGLAIQTIHPDRSLPDCVAEASESLAAGKAKRVLTNLLA